LKALSALSDGYSRDVCYQCEIDISPAVYVIYDDWTVKQNMNCDDRLTPKTGPDD